MYQRHQPQDELSPCQTVDWATPFTGTIRTPADIAPARFDVRELPSAP
ncbi:MAG: hypothetical protein JNM18_26880 [Planctomycetaceae bacterium]|nr:hypothetical protein [Planctomycetaceae bacterium]